MNYSENIYWKIQKYQYKTGKANWFGAFTAEKVYWRSRVHQVVDKNQSWRDQWTTAIFHDRKHKSAQRDALKSWSALDQNKWRIAEISNKIWQQGLLEQQNNKLYGCRSN